MKTENLKKRIMKWLVERANIQKKIDQLIQADQKEIGDWLYLELPPGKQMSLFECNGGHDPLYFEMDGDLFQVVNGQCWIEDDLIKLTPTDLAKVVANHPDAPF